MIVQILTKADSANTSQPTKTKTGQLIVDRFCMEAPPGFEPGNQGVADPRLTTWL